MSNPEAAHEHDGGSLRVIFFVWGSLLALTLVETFLAYQQLEIKVMLGILMTLSIVKASLIIAYFMHLRYERRSLALALMPALVFVIGMMFTVFPDGIRAALMKVR
jgi:cytochrome c oxidase subunit IV